MYCFNLRAAQRSSCSIISQLLRVARFSLASSSANGTACHKYSPPSLHPKHNCLAPPQSTHDSRPLAALDIPRLARPLSDVERDEVFFAWVGGAEGGVVDEGEEGAVAGFGLLRVRHGLAEGPEGEEAGEKASRRERKSKEARRTSLTATASTIAFSQTLYFSAAVAGEKDPKSRNV